MNFLPQPPPLAAVNDEGILLHDIFGVLCLIVLLVLGFLLRQRQRRMAAAPVRRVPQIEPLPGRREASSQPARIERGLMWVMAWSLYAVVLAAVSVFFFVTPRATSQRAQVTPEQRNSGQTFDGRN